MKNYLRYLLKNIITILVIFVVGFLAPLVVIELINDSVSYYEATFEVNDIENIDYEKFLDITFLNEIKENGANGKYQGINVEKMIANDDFSYTINNNNITIVTKAKYYEEFFISSSNSVGTRAKMFIKDSVIAACDENAIIIFKNGKDIVELKNSVNGKYKISVIVAIAFLIIELIVAAFLFKYKNNNNVENENNISNCFQRKYWNLAAKPLNKVKDITTIAMLFALMLVCKLIPIPSGFGNLGLSFTYLFFAIVAMIYGPIYGFVIGVFSDVIGFFVSGSSGIFHLGYTMQAALTGFIYGLCLFKTKIRFSNVLLCRLLINVLINALYGSFLYVLVFYTDDSMTFQRFFELFKSYMLLLSLPKNIVYLLPQSILLYYVIKATTPVLNRFNLIDKTITNKKQSLTK